MIDKNHIKNNLIYFLQNKIKDEVKVEEYNDAIIVQKIKI